MPLPKKITYLPVVWQVRKALLFCKFFIIALVRYKDLSLISQTSRYFSQWNKSVRRNNNPLDYDQPWIVYGAIDFIKSIIKSEMTVWEYGSGSSTLFYARRVSKVYSIENDKLWYEHILQTMNDQSISNVVYKLIPHDIEDEENVSEFISKSTKKTFRTYVQSINDIPNESLDIVIIDGRARAACISYAMPKVCDGGYLIVDNSDRAYYFEGNDELLDNNKWEGMHFIGLVPYTFSFSKTSFYRKIAQ